MEINKSSKNLMLGEGANFPATINFNLFFDVLSNVCFDFLQKTNIFNIPDLIFPHLKLLIFKIVTAAFGNEIHNFHYRSFSGRRNLQI